MNSFALDTLPDCKYTAVPTARRYQDYEYDTSRVATGWFIGRCNILIDRGAHRQDVLGLPVSEGGLAELSIQCAVKRKPLAAVSIAVSMDESSPAYVEPHFKSQSASHDKVWSCEEPPAPF